MAPGQSALQSYRAAGPLITFLKATWQRRLCRAEPFVLHVIFDRHKRRCHVAFRNVINGPAAR
jgi:hypothetical protein